MIQSPCYDPVTRESCSIRGLGCRSTCPAWAVYEVLKKEEYAKRSKQRDAESDVCGYGRTLRKRILRRIHRGK